MLAGWRKTGSMEESKSKSRKKLNNLQNEILLILYKFRFATADLIVKYQERDSKRYTNTRLRILYEQKLIGRNYDKSSIINRKPANYYLLTEGIRLLKQGSGLNDTVLNTIYRDRYAGEVFIKESLRNFGLYNKLNELYKSDLGFYSKSEMSEFDYMIRPLPDAFIALGNDSEGFTEYILEVVKESTPFFAAKKRIKKYSEHAESGDWDEAETDYPILLLICETAAIERRTQKQTSSILEVSEGDNLTIYTTTLKALLTSSSSDDLIWSDVLEPDNLISLK